MLNLVNMSKVYSIVRVSSVGQSDNTSLKHQKETIKKYCDLYNLELNEIIEEVYTGTTEDRDGLNYLMDKVKNGECDTIVVYKIDRLIRSFRSGINYIGDLIKYGCKIISTQEQIDTSSISGKFFLNVMLSLSEMEKSTITQRLNRGKKHRFKTEGKMVCSSPPFGYQKKSDSVLLDDNSSIVKLIFKLFNRYINLDKNSRTRKIIKYLNKNGYTFKGVPFRGHHIKNIVNNPFYKGFISYGELGIQRHHYPRLVSPRLWNKVSLTYSS